MKIKSQIVVVVLILSFVAFSPLTAVNAREDTEELKNLVEQLSAIVTYLENKIPKTTYSTLSNEEIKEIIVGGVEWIIASQEDNGHFTYEYKPYEGEYADDDNIVRQAGTLYALTEVERRDKNDNFDLNKTIESSISFFEQLSPEDEYQDETLRCITKNENSIVCQLGATSLALTAILGYVEAYPEKSEVYENLIESYVTYIMSAKKPDTGFRDEYRVSTGFRGDKESPFSNGEALLALVRYYQYNQREDVKQVIDETFEYLKDKEFESPLYLWIMAALKDMNVLWPSEDYVSYGKEFTDWRMERLTWRHQTNKNYCAPVEGLASALSLLDNNIDSTELLLLRKELDFWNAKNSSFQIGLTDTYRLVAGELGVEIKKAENMQLAKGGFLTAYDEPTQRIDYTQHCVSTYLQTLVDVAGESI